MTLLCAAGACDSFTIRRRRRTYTVKFQPATIISYTDPRDEHTRDGSLKRKGFLYTLSGFFSFLLTYRIYLRPAQPPAAGGSRSPPPSRRRTVVGQILRCGTHTRTLYPLYIIHVHMQHKYPVRYAVVF